MIVDLVLVLGEPFSTNPGFFVLDLAGDEVVDEEGRALAEELLGVVKESMEVGELVAEGGQGAVEGFGSDGLEVDGGCVENILDITVELCAFPLQFDGPVHLETGI